MLHNRLLRAGVAFLVVVAAGIGVASATASASPTKHKVSFSGPGTSGAIESGVKGSFSCNSATGAFTFKVRGVQPFESDSYTPWSPVSPQTFGLQTSLGGTFFGIILLSQDHATGLFDGKLTSSQDSVKTTCATASVLHITDFPGSGWLTIDASLN